MNGVATKITEGASTDKLTVTGVTERSDVYCSLEYSNGITVQSKHAVLDVRGKSALRFNVPNKNVAFFYLT